MRPLVLGLLLLLAPALPAQDGLLGMGDGSGRPSAPPPAVGPPAALGPSADRSWTALVTGNGFGFGVYSPRTGGLSKLYLHPYRFMKPDPDDPKDDGVETAEAVGAASWSGEAGGSAGYLEQSQVVLAAGPKGEAAWFMPWGLARTALVTTWKGAGAAPVLNLRFSHPLAGKRAVRVGGRPAWRVKLAEVDETLLLVPLDSVGPRGPRFDGALTGASGWALVSLDREAEVETAADELVAWAGADPPAGLAAREVRELEAWRAAPNFVSEAERRVWRQSETVLRMAQIREPDRDDRHSHGLIVASLPDNEFFIPWVRDMCFAAVALVRMGHREEARAALTGMLEARPVGPKDGQGRPYQISTVRYFGTGAEEADFDGRKQPNLEYDDWGLALWACREYVERSGDTGWLRTPTYRGSVFENLRDYVAAPLVDVLVPAEGGKVVAPDSSVWEQNDEARQSYAFSSIAAIQGLRGFLALAAAAGDAAAATQVRAPLQQLERGFAATFMPGGRLRGRADGAARNETDGSLLVALDLGVVVDPEARADLLARMELLRTASGGYRRTLGSSPYELQEFLFVDFTLARVLLRAGERGRAEELVARITARAEAHHDLIPEMYVSAPSKEFPGPIGAPAGAMPMAGYGAGAFISFVLERGAAQGLP